MRKVQDIIRGLFPGAWNKGFSVCFVNTAYTGTHMKKNYKFAQMELDPSARGREAEVMAALTAEGYRPLKVQIAAPYRLQVWMEPTSIVR